MARFKMNRDEMADLAKRVWGVLSLQGNRRGLTVGAMIGVVLFVVIAVSIFPTVQTASTNAYNSTRDGSAELAMLNLIPLLYAVTIILVVIATAIGEVKGAGMIKAISLPRPHMPTILTNRRGSSAFIGLAITLMLALVIGLSLYPTVSESVWNEVRSNAADPASGLKAGAQYVMLNLIPLLYLIGLVAGVLLVAIGSVYVSRRSKGKGKTGL